MKTPSVFRSAIGVTLFCAAAFALWAAMGRQTQGAISSGILYLVDSTGDGDLVGPSTNCDDGTGHCTLRAAIEASNLHAGSDFISFNIPTTDPGFSNGMWAINLPRALPDLSDSVSISGPGADKLTVQGNASTPAFRIFNVTTTGIVSFSGLTIANGLGEPTSGGGIQNVNAGTVNVTNCVLSNNSASHGGGISNNSTGTVNITSSTLSGNHFPSSALTGNGGAIYNNSGTVTVTNSTLRDSGHSTGNSIGGNGGAIYNNSGTVTVTNSTIRGNSANKASNDPNSGFGGGIFNNATLNVTGSTISFNSAVNGGGIYNNNGTTTVTNSTLSGNPANSNGGGIFNNFGTVNVTNSTLSANSAFTSGLSGGSGGGIFNGATLNVTNSTVTGNIAGDVSGTGGGIVSTGANPNTQVRSTIVALNMAPSSGPDVSGPFGSGGFNLIGKKDGSTGFTASTDQTGTIASPLDPKLDPNGLRNNGGSTQTIALLFGSPAIDKGTSNGLTGTLTTDQRGVGYKRTIDKSVANAAGGDGTDIGAFEFGAKIKAISSKTHGIAGTFTVNLPLFGPKLGVECRNGGASGVFKVILTFPSAVTVSDASVTADPAAPGATASVSSFSVSGSKVTVNLTGVSNAQTMDVNLLGVSNGTVTNDVSVPMGVLLGDTNGDRSVTTTDVNLTQSKVGQAVTKSTFREDVTADGVINNTDVNLVQSKVGTKLP